MDNKEIFIKKLIYQSLHRGCKETDIILGEFAKEELSKLDIQALLDFEKLLQLNDNDIYSWFSAQKELNTTFTTDILNRIKEFHTKKCLNLN